MLQDELARLTLTELDKRDERQDVERVCQFPSHTITCQILPRRNAMENLETERTDIIRLHGSPFRL